MSCALEEHMQLEGHYNGHERTGLSAENRKEKIYLQCPEVREGLRANNVPCNVADLPHPLLPRVVTSSSLCRKDNHGSVLAVTKEKGSL